MQEDALLVQPLAEQITDPSRDGFGSSRTRKSFRRRHRLLKNDVLALLRDGARLGRPEVMIRLHENTYSFGRIAIAVPKRILKRAIDRNRVKRVIREEFRQHALRSVPVDMLVTLRSAMGVRPGEQAMGQQQRQQLRATLARLFHDVDRRFSGAI